MVAFVGKDWMSKFFSTEEAFVREREHRNTAQHLGQKVGEWPGGGEQGQRKEVYWHQAMMLATLSRGHVPGPLLASGFCTEENGLGASLADSPMQ